MFALIKDLSTRGFLNRWVLVRWVNTDIEAGPGRRTDPGGLVEGADFGHLVLDSGVVGELG